MLGVNGKTIKPIGMGTVLLKIEDDLKHVQALEIQDVRHMPEILLNIFVPQAFIQQRQSKGDSVASCSINATGITLKWMSESGQEASKYVPLNKSNIGIAFTASGYKNFKAFATMLVMPATYVSDDEEDDTVPSPSLDEQLIRSTSPSPHGDPVCSPSEGAMHSPSDGVTMDFKADPHLIPQEPDAPLMASDQALLMAYHEQLSTPPLPSSRSLPNKVLSPRNWPMCLRQSAPVVFMEKPTRSHGGHTRLIPKSSHPLYLVLLLALTNWNPQFLVLSRLQGANQQPATTVVQCVC